MELRRKVKIFWILTFGTLLMAVGVYFFKFPNNFTFGGITGLSVVVAKTGVSWQRAWNYDNVLQCAAVICIGCAGTLRSDGRTADRSTNDGITVCSSGAGFGECAFI